MAKLSVIIPARNERYLIPTIEDVFKQARGEVEVVAVLEGYWPEGWKDLVAKYPHLHTIHHGEAKGMRASINEGAASAISRGTKYLAKFDAHCCFGEGFDEIIKADMDADWIVVPRRKRLDPETFAPRDDGRLDIDYHYLTFPDNVKDFGGPGLNGRVWEARARERLGKPEFDIDDEMSSQGSGWAMHAAYFERMSFMDAASYGQFWNEFQELGLSCWLSGGQVKVNKKTWYAHWHKGSAGRGYHLPKEWLAQGATFTKRWLFNEASTKQTLPFKTLIERFWPVPGWPENWEELVYGETRQSAFITGVDNHTDKSSDSQLASASSSLTIHSATYGIGGPDDLDVADVLRRKVVSNSLDILVTNADLEVGNPFRGQKKRLTVTYSYNGSEQVTVVKEERDWLIIGQSSRYVKAAQPFLTVDADVFTNVQMQETFGPNQLGEIAKIRVENVPDIQISERILSAAALTDLLIRRFQIPSHRLRGPMPIEVPTFHRNDLAKLFAELGFMHGAEIGVAEGKFSEVLLKANPDLHLLLVDPWHAYSGNPQNKSKEKNEYAYNECARKVSGYRNAKMDMRLSMEAVLDVPDGSLDFCYVDAHHSYQFCMPDICEWAKKVRSGGIVAGDDVYRLNEKWGAGPMEAVYDYTRAMRIEPWWLINAHKSVDFFWIKP